MSTLRLPRDFDAIITSNLCTNYANQSIFLPFVKSNIRCTIGGGSRLTSFQPPWTRSTIGSISMVWGPHSRRHRDPQTASQHASSLPCLHVNAKDSTERIDRRSSIRTRWSWPRAWIRQPAAPFSNEDFERLVFLSKHPGTGLLFSSAAGSSIANALLPGD